MNSDDFISNSYSGSKGTIQGISHPVGRPGKSGNEFIRGMSEIVGFDEMEFADDHESTLALYGYFWGGRLQSKICLSWSPSRILLALLSLSRSASNSRWRNRAAADPGRSDREKKRVSRFFAANGKERKAAEEGVDQSREVAK